MATTLYGGPCSISTGLFFTSTAEREAIADELVSARKYMAIVDGLIVGEKESPLAPSPRACGLMLGGFNPVAVDSVGTAMLGFDTRKIPQIYKAFQTRYCRWSGSPRPISRCAAFLESINSRYLSQASLSQMQAVARDGRPH